DHEFAHWTACLQHAKSVKEAALVTVDFMRKTALQSLARVVQPLLRVTDTVQQLVRERPRATVDPALKIGNVGHDQFRRSARRRRAQVCDEIANSEVDLVTDCRDDRHGGMDYCARDNLFVEFP